MVYDLGIVLVGNGFFEEFFVKVNDFMIIKDSIS